MTVDRWRRLSTVIDGALVQPTAHRQEWLREACAGDEALLNEVTMLLAQEEEGFTGIHGAMQSASIDLLAHRNGMEMGSRIGVFRITGVLGQGGMGSVYEAERDDGSFAQRVAIKIVKREIDSADARRRFRNERQILAALEHPNIARLLDGGESEEGLPYLVMEFIEGRPITGATSGWPIARKLQLFRDVVAAVAFAHRNLIVHRDLKPSNILVTAAGDPKLLDFGIAKLLDQEAGIGPHERTLTSANMMTPDYASPEQVKGELIGTASDIYSLGAILYELLTGVRPHRLESYSTAEIYRAICEEEPKPPSVASKNQQLQGDLDTLVLTALAKEPGSRYATAEAFSDDIERYLDGRPLKVRPASTIERSWKFAKRNRLAVGAGIALAVSLIGGAAISMYQAKLANDRFQQVRTLAHTFVFDVHDEIAKLQGSTQAREMVVRTALEYLDRLSKGASRDLDLQKELAAAYQKVGDAQGSPANPNLGRTADAIASYRKAKALHEQVAARDPSHRRELGHFYTRFAQLMQLTGNRDEARSLLRMTLATFEPLAIAQPDDLALQRDQALAFSALGDLEDELDHNQTAWENFRHAVEIADRVLARNRDFESLDLAQITHSGLAAAARDLGRLTEAQQQYTAADVLLREQLQQQPGNPRLHRRLALVHQGRSVAYFDDLYPHQGDPAQALLHAQRYFDEIKASTEADPRNASARLSLAIAYYRLSIPLRRIDLPKAIAAARQSVEIFDERVAAGGGFLAETRRARAQRSLAEALLSSGDPVAAKPFADASAAANRAAVKHAPLDSSASNFLVWSLVTAANVNDAAGDSKAARDLLDEADKLAKANLAPNPGWLLGLIAWERVRNSQAAYARNHGDPAGAREWTRKAAQLWRDFPGHNDYVDRRRRESGN